MGDVQGILSGSRRYEASGFAASYTQNRDLASRSIDVDEESKEGRFEVVGLIQQKSGISEEKFLVIARLFQARGEFSTAANIRGVMQDGSRDINSMQRVN